MSESTSTTQQTPPSPPPPVADKATQQAIAAQPRGVRKESKKPETRKVMLWAPKQPYGLHIGLTNGHTLIISGDREGTEVPPMFRKEAIARGCLPVGMEDDDVESNTFDRQRVIVDAIKAAMNTDDPDAFTRDGVPSQPYIEKKIGFRLERGELLRAWEIVEKDED